MTFNTITLPYPPPIDSNAAELPLVCGYVITYNGKRFLDHCLATLEQLTDYENFHLILVDNGSTDGSGNHVRVNFPGVEVLRVFPNAGYAHGANEAIRDARRRGAKYIALMNDDIAILHSEWLREAVLHAERDRRIGIIGFVETAPEEGAQRAPESKLTDFEYLGSAILVIPIEMFDRVGMLDEVYFVGGDESELGVRAQAAGYRAVKLGIPIYHFGGGTINNFSRSMAYMDMRNGIRYCLKNRSLKRAFLRAVRILEVACNPWPVTFDDRDPAHGRMRNSGNVVVNLLLWLRAVSWNIVYFPQTYRMRAAERKLIRAARAEWNELNAMAINGTSRRRQPANSSYSGAEMGDRI